MRKHRNSLVGLMLAILLATLLSACGSGGGDPAQILSAAPAATATPSGAATPDPNPSPSPSPTPSGAPDTLAGLYFGTTSGNGTYDVLILGNGRYYGMLGGANGALTNVQVGTGTLTETSFTSSFANDFALLSGAITRVSLAVSGAAKNQVSGALPAGGTFRSFYSASFEETPSLARAVGAYTGDAAGPQGIGLISMTVDATGALSGTTRGCSFTGSVAENATANVYDLRVTFGAGCVNPGVTFTGHALLSSVAGNQTRMTAFAPRSDLNQVLFFVATRP